ncbi:MULTISPECIES: Fur family transcriptional regulator [Bacillales]|jgi:Fur family zinc uptake transcriptional regulator|uniref:Transcriptional repressor n=1 Tax=Brevibacillus aydinogluensis TaxID=927786 RepID=A0AA48RG97_9BACL|nr:MULTISPECIES: Fur family transcriptional regulator [Bacillales]REK67431.1 MAG: transcriptional repressor [Brevibacillus sp.]MBR8659853.1 transcriptional repressor [Brevibacillus sp. NL20B1]MDT3416800.1 Fur family zinc uptake transcriptional regulator [Brevibacillus aydinogluensis]NNV04234.1 transcriptional repressor [Brevibacillus sp. MCWH]UFJ62326.1 transcriptional repressor [Anoxybacillus sediminis]
MTVEEALQILKENGYKYTGKREEMIRICAEEKRYLSAKEIMERIRDHYPSLSFDTVYRNISTFVKLGILEETELDGEGKYRLACSVDGHHHHHVICTVCGKTSALPGCPMSVLQSIPEEFQVTGHKFEVYGTCKECRPAQ